MDGESIFLMSFCWPYIVFKCRTQGYAQMLAGIGSDRKVRRGGMSSYSIYCGKKLREHNLGALSFTTTLCILRFIFLRERSRRKDGSS